MRLASAWSAAAGAVDLAVLTATLLLVGLVAFWAALVAVALLLADELFCANWAWRSASCLRRKAMRCAFSRCKRASCAAFSLAVSVTALSSLFVSNAAVVADFLGNWVWIRGVSSLISSALDDKS